MKKILSLLLILCISICFTGCKEEEEVLASYDIDVELLEDMTLDCEMEYSFISNYDNQNGIYFALYPNSFDNHDKNIVVYEEDFLLAYPNGESYGNMQINSVKINGKTAEFKVDGKYRETLKVGFNKPLNKREKLSVYISFKVKLPNINHRFGYGDNTINLTNFYPIACVYDGKNFYQNTYSPNGDPFYSECANYKLNLTLPSEYTVASSLNCEKVIWNENYTTYSYERNRVRDIALILSKKFSVLEKDFNGVKVKYYYYDDNEPQKSLEYAGSSLSYFSNKYKNYEYSEYTVAQADFLYGGMEYPCLSMISSDLFGEDNFYTIVHETAHQWFYGILGVNESESGYLDEGLTEFSTALFLGEYNDFKSSFSDLISKSIKNYTLMRKALLDSGNKIPPIMERNLNDFTSELEYVTLCYNRSEIMFYDLLNFMGEKRFFKALNDIFKSYSYKNLTTKILKNAFEKHKKGATLLIESYLNGTKVIKSN